MFSRAIILECSFILANMSEQEKLTTLIALMNVSPTITCAALSAVAGGSNWKEASEQIKLPPRQRNKVHKGMKSAMDQDNARRYQVVLFNHGVNKIHLIKFIRHLSGMSLGEAKAASETPKQEHEHHQIGWIGIFSAAQPFDDAFHTLQKLNGIKNDDEIKLALYDADEIENYKFPFMGKYDSFGVDGNYGVREPAQKYNPIDVNVEGKNVKVLMALGTWENTREANIFPWTESI